MIIRKIKALSLGIVMWSFATTGYAVESGFYMGVQIGNSKVNNGASTVQINSHKIGPIKVYGTEVVTPSNTGMAERIYVGGQYNPFAAVELGFTHYAPSTFNVTAPTSTLTGNPQIRTIAIDLVGKGIFPVGNSGFGIFGKAGLAAASQSKSGSLQVNSLGQPISGQGNKTSANLIYGLGVSYDVTQSWVADLTWSQIKAAGGIPTSTFLALGFSYHIVQKKCGQFLC